MSDVNPYKLSTDEHEKRYAKIEAEYLPKSTAQERPHAVITGGQPGSGKSGITAGAKSDLTARGGFLLIDADLLRLRHPNYTELLHTNDRTAANLTHPDAGVWAARLLVAGAAAKRNLIIDQTSKDPGALVNLSDKLRSLGYTVELRAMAVNEKISEQRIHSRYEGQKFEVGVGRFSTKDNHDFAYKGLPLSVDAVEKNRSVDSIKLFDKDHRQIYSNELRNGQWEKAEQARIAMETERGKSMTLPERKAYSETYDKLLGLVGRPERKASADEIKVLSDLQQSARRGLMAAVFREEEPVRAVQRYAELATAYGHVRAHESKAERDGLTVSQKSVVMVAVRDKVAERIERGDLPDIQVVASKEVLAEKKREPER